jgi:hypothetical protein
MQGSAAASCVLAAKWPTAWRGTGYPFLMPGFRPDAGLFDVAVAGARSQVAISVNPLLAWRFALFDVSAAGARLQQELGHKWLYLSTCSCLHRTSHGFGRVARGHSEEHVDPLTTLVGVATCCLLFTNVCVSCQPASALQTPAGCDGLSWAPAGLRGLWLARLRLARLWLHLS